MAKELIIDIGTHEAQELRVLNGDKSYVIPIYLGWWLDWIKRKIKKLIRYNGLIEYGTGGFKYSPMGFGFSNHKRLLKQLCWPSDYLEERGVLAIDPVSQITTKYLERLDTKSQISFLPIAVLPHDNETECKLEKFYIEKNSLSSSLTKSNDSELIICSAYSFRKIVRELKEHKLIKKDSEIILRMNCEGSEFGVIQDLIDEGYVPSIVMGSINDVRKKYGDEEADEMDKMLQENNIRFKYFKGSDPGTWITAFDEFGK